MFLALKSQEGNAEEPRRMSEASGARLCTQHSVRTKQGKASRLGLGMVLTSTESVPCARHGHTDSPRSAPEPKNESTLWCSHAQESECPICCRCCCFFFFFEKPTCSARLMCSSWRAVPVAGVRSEGCGELRVESATPIAREFQVGGNPTSTV